MQGMYSLSLYLSSGSKFHAGPWPLQDQFPVLSFPSSFSPASNTYSLQIIFSHLFLDFSADLPSGIFINTFFTFFSSRILSAFPNHRKLWLVQIVHTMFSFTGPNISLSIFLPIFLKYSYHFAECPELRIIHYYRSRNYCSLNSQYCKESSPCRDLKVSSRYSKCRKHWVCVCVCLYVFVRACGWRMSSRQRRVLSASYLNTCW